MHAVYLNPRCKKLTVAETPKSTKKNNRRSIRLIEHFIKPTETELKAIADFLSALVNKSCSAAAGSDAKNSAGSNQEVNS